MQRGSAVCSSLVKHAVVAGLDGIQLLCPLGFPLANFHGDGDDEDSEQLLNTLKEGLV
jgi:hypothetical protein